MDTQEFKSRIAEAVHEAVCQVSQTDGCGRCLYYALAGAMLLNRVTKRLFVPQVGGLSIQTSPPDGWYGVDMSAQGDPIQSFYDGDFHCWIAEVPEGGTEPGSRQRCKALIDLSSRHYDRLFDFIMPPIEWKREPPPAYLWLDDGIMPDWVRMWPEAEPMSVLFDTIHMDVYVRRDLFRIALDHFHRHQLRASKSEKALALRRYKRALKVKK